MARRLAAVALLLGATGCYPYWTGQRLEERIQALENASKETRAQQDALRRDFEDRFAQRLQKIDDSLESFSKSAHLTTAEVGARVDELLGQVQSLRGQLEQSGFAREDLGKRLDELETKVAALGGEKALEKVTAKKALAEVERPADKKAFFALAKSYHDKKEWAFSRPLFAEFIQKWKFDELAPQAQLHIGDSYFEEKNYRAAILEYQRVRETWKTSKQVPDSLYKLGLSFLELGLKDEAKLFLEEAAKFSGQQAGKDAKAKLKELSSAGKKPPPPKGAKKR